jgi:DNA/RNA-binding domain of Phe-tRNA-synthetase-like protein
MELYMLSISATNELQNTHPGALIGLLELSNVTVLSASPQLNEQKRETEKRLRHRYTGFTRQDFLSLPVISAYDRYYRKFNKTYHVLQQVESIALKGKNLPDVSPLVDANFMAEVETLVLTASHDVAKLHGVVSMDVGRAGDQLVQMNGMPKAILVGDMLMRDSHGVSCSIIYGQDNVSLITSETTHVLYVAYAPAGVPTEQVSAQLQRIKENVLLFSATMVVEQQQLLFI